MVINMKGNGRKQQLCFFLWGWIGTNSTITEATTELFYQSRMTMEKYECRVIGGVLGRENRNT
jgi:hypothetical protein